MPPPTIPTNPGLWPARGGNEATGPIVVVVEIFDTDGDGLRCGRQLDTSGWGPELPMVGVALPDGWTWGDEIAPLRAA